MIETEYIFKAIQELNPQLKQKNKEQIKRWFQTLSIPQHNQSCLELSQYLYEKNLYQNICLDQFILLIKKDIGILNKKEDIIKALIKDSITDAITVKSTSFPGLDLELVLNE